MSLSDRLNDGFCHVTRYRFVVAALVFFLSVFFFEKAALIEILLAVPLGTAILVSRINGAFWYARCVGAVAVVMGAYVLANAGRQIVFEIQSTGHIIASDPSAICSYALTPILAIVAMAAQLLAAAILYFIIYLPCSALGPRVARISLVAVCIVASLYSGHEAVVHWTNSQVNSGDCI